MTLVFNPDVFALGIAVGVLGLVLMLSLIIAYAYDERTLLMLAAYVATMVGLTFAGNNTSINNDLAQNLLLICGPALIAILEMWLLRNRQNTLVDKAAMSIIGVATLGLLVFYVIAGDTGASRILSLAWLVLLVATSCYLSLQSWESAGPWKWWLLLGHTMGLSISGFFLADVAEAPQVYWPVVLMLLLQVPPIYLSLVWRSRLLNESKLRSAAANVTDPLTGLATTSVLLERLLRAMSRAHQQQGTTVSAIFLIEVNNWAGLLHELGAEIGEKLLLESALRLRRSIGDNDLVARIAGGRFAVVAQSLASQHEVTDLATRLVVSGLRIDSPLLPGVELRFRVIVCDLKVPGKPTLPAAESWLTALSERFNAWPHSHRTRSILTLADIEI